MEDHKVIHASVIPTRGKTSLVTGRIIAGEIVLETFEVLSYIFELIEHKEKVFKNGKLINLEVFTERNENFLILDNENKLSNFYYIKDVFNILDYEVLEFEHGNLENSKNRIKARITNQIKLKKNYKLNQMKLMKN